MFSLDLIYKGPVYLGMCCVGQIYIGYKEKGELDLKDLSSPLGGPYLTG